MPPLLAGFFIFLLSAFAALATAGPLQPTLCGAAAWCSPELPAWLPRPATTERREFLVVSTATTYAAAQAACVARNASLITPGQYAIAALNVSSLPRRSYWANMRLDPATNWFRGDDMTQPTGSSNQSTLQIVDLSLWREVVFGDAVFSASQAAAASPPPATTTTTPTPLGNGTGNATAAPAPAAAAAVAPTKISVSTGVLQGLSGCFYLEFDNSTTTGLQMWRLRQLTSCGTSAAALSVMCERTIAPPASWAALKGSSLEATLSSATATAEEAGELCEAWGGSLAAPPSSYTTMSAFYAALAPTLPASSLIPTLGVRLASYATATKWSDIWALSTETFFGPLTNGSVISTTGVWIAAAVGDRRPFACMRLARPATAEVPCVNVDAPTTPAYSYVPFGAGLTPLARRQALPNRTEAIAECLRRGGSIVSRFNQPAGIASCFGNSSGTYRLLSTRELWYWGDDNSQTASPMFPNETYFASYVRELATQVDTTPDVRMPAVCQLEYGGPLRVRVRSPTSFVAVAAGTTINATFMPYRGSSATGLTRVCLDAASSAVVAGPSTCPYWFASDVGVQTATYVVNASAHTGLYTIRLVVQNSSLAVVDSITTQIGIVGADAATGANWTSSPPASITPAAVVPFEAAWDYDTTTWWNASGSEEPIQLGSDDGTTGAYFVTRIDVNWPSCVVLDPLNPREPLAQPLVQPANASGTIQFGLVCLTATPQSVTVTVRCASPAEAESASPTGVYSCLHLPRSLQAAFAIVPGDLVWSITESTGGAVSGTTLKLSGFRPNWMVFRIQVPPLASGQNVTNSWSAFMDGSRTWSSSAYMGGVVCVNFNITDSTDVSPSTPFCSSANLYAPATTNTTYIAVNWTLPPLSLLAKSASTQMEVKLVGPGADLYTTASRVYTVQALPVYFNLTGFDAASYPEALTRLTRTLYGSSIECPLLSGTCAPTALISIATASVSLPVSTDTVDLTLAANVTGNYSVVINMTGVFKDTFVLVPSVANVNIRPAAPLNVSNVTQYLYVGADAVVVTAALTQPFVRLLSMASPPVTAVDVSLDGPALEFADDSSIRSTELVIAGTNGSAGAVYGADVGRFALIGTRLATSQRVALSIGSASTTPQFVLSKTLTFYVVAPAVVTVIFATTGPYYVGVTYQVDASVSRLPLESGASITVFANGTGITSLTNVTFGGTGGTSTTGAFTFRIDTVPANEQANVALNLVGTGRRGFVLSQSALVISPVQAQVCVIVDPPRFLLQNDTSVYALTLSVSRPLQVLTSLSITITTKCAVKFYNSTATSTTVSWGLGTQTPIVVQLGVDQTSACLDGFLNFTVAAVPTSIPEAKLYLSSSDACDDRIVNYTIPITTRAVVSISTDEATVLTMAQNRTSCFNVSITRSPTVGSVLYVGVDGPGAQYAAVVNSTPLAFYPTANDGAQSLPLCIVGVAITAGVSPLPKFHLVLSGTATLSYFDPMNTTERAVQVDPAVQLLYSIPSVVIIGSDSPRTGYVTLPEALPDGTSVTLNFGITPLACYNDLQCIVLTTPSVVLDANHSTAPLVFTAYNGPGKTVTLTSVNGGTAPAFAAITASIAVAAKRRVTVNAPSASEYFRGDVAYLVVSVDALPLDGARLTFTVTSVCGTAAATWCEMAVPVDAFDSSTDLSVSIPLRAVTDVSAPTVISATVTFPRSETESSAAPQYDLTTNTYVVSVRFVPRRAITRIDSVSRVFLQQPVTLQLNSSSLPDANTSVSVTATAIGANSTAATWAGSTLLVPAQGSLVRTLQLTVTTFTSSRISVSFSLTGSPAVSALRFTVPSGFSLDVLRKVHVNLIAPLPRATQLVGSNNQQQLSFNLSHFPENATYVRLRPTYDAAFTDLLTFTPPTLLWLRANGTATNVLTVIGNSAGNATVLQFDAACDSMEEIDTVSTSSTLMAPFMSQLVVTGLREIRMSGSNASMVVGSLSLRVITVSLSAAPLTYPVVVSLSYGNDTTTQAALNCTPSTLTFAAGSAVTSQSFWCAAVAPASSTALRLAIIEGAEYSPTVAGWVAFNILPPTSVSIFLTGPAQVSSSEPLGYSTSITVTSETNLTMSLSMNNFPAAMATAVATSVSVTVPNASETASAYTALAPDWLSSRPLYFTATTLHTDLAVAFVCLTNRSFTAVITIDFDNGASIYSIAVTVVPLLTLEVSGLPANVTTLATNTRRFTVSASLNPLVDFSEVVTLSLDLSDCASTAATVVPTFALEWSQSVAGAVPIDVTGVTPGQSCRIRIVKANSLASSSAPAFLDATIRVLNAPQVRYGVNGTTDAVDALDSPRMWYFTRSSVSIQSEADELPLHALHGTFVAWTNETPSAGGEGSGSSDVTVSTERILSISYGFGADGAQTVLDTSSSAVYVHSSLTATDAPRGVQAVIQSGACANFVRVILTTTTTQSSSNSTSGAGDSVSAVNARLVLGPCADLRLSIEETLTVRFGPRAFTNSPYPTPAGANVTIVLSAQGADLLSSADWAGVQIPAAVALFGAPWLPALSLQPMRIVAPLIALDCPSTPDTLTLRQQSLPTMYLWFDASAVAAIADPNDYGIWFSVVLINVLIVLGFLLLHLTAAAAVYFRQKTDAGRTFLDACGSLRFPSFFFFIAFFFVGAVVEAAVRTVAYSGRVDLAISAVLLGSLAVVVLPFFIHGVVWRNRSLTFRESGRRGPISLIRLMVASGRWSHPKPNFTRRYGSLFQVSRGSFRWHILFEYVASVLFAGIAGIQPTESSGCVARAACMAAVVGTTLVVILLWRPYRRPVYNLFFVVLYAVELALLIVVAQIARRGSLDDAATANAVAVAGSASSVLLVFGIYTAAATLARNVLRSGDGDPLTADAIGLDANAGDAELLLLDGAAKEANELAAAQREALLAAEEAQMEEGRSGSSSGASQADYAAPSEPRQGYEGPNGERFISIAEAMDDATPLEPTAALAVDALLRQTLLRSAVGHFVDVPTRGDESAFSPLRRVTLVERREAQRRHRALTERPPPRPEVGDDDAAGAAQFYASGDNAGNETSAAATDYDFGGAALAVAGGFSQQGVNELDAWMAHLSTAEVGAMSVPIPRQACRFREETSRPGNPDDASLL